MENHRFSIQEFAGYFKTKPFRARTLDPCDSGRFNVRFNINFSGSFNASIKCRLLRLLPREPYRRPTMRNVKWDTQTADRCRPNDSIVKYVVLAMKTTVCLSFYIWSLNIFFCGIRPLPIDTKIVIFSFKQKHSVTWRMSLRKYIYFR